MAQVVGHLSLDELQAGYRGSGDATLARHYQVIWLLAQGRTCPEVAGLTSFAPRWVEQLLARYNAFGPGSLGDRRRGNGAAPRVLTAAMLAAVRERVRRPPDDGGVWTAKKVVLFMAAELGRRVAEQRGWEALRAIGWTIQSPRPQHAEAATPEEQEAFKKRMARPVCKLISSMLPFQSAPTYPASELMLPAQMELRASRSSQDSRRRCAVF